MTGEIGVVYLICFRRRYKHAGHYIGWTNSLLRRLRTHARGNPCGKAARLMVVIHEAGIEWDLVCAWEGTRDDERRLKNRHGANKFCPRCNTNPQRVSLPRVDEREIERAQTALAKAAA